MGINKCVEIGCIKRSITPRRTQYRELKNDRWMTDLWILFIDLGRWNSVTTALLLNTIHF